MLCNIHILKINHRSELPLRMLWVDTEALNEHGKPEAGEQRLWFGRYIYERYSDASATTPVRHISGRFERAMDFWIVVDSLTEPKSRLWILAHNWNYDAGILDASGCLPELGYSLGKYINGKPPLIVTWRKESKTIMMVDTLNYFTIPFMRAGSAILYVGSTLSEKAVPGSYSYVVTKHATIGMMRATCQDLAGRGVHTACICPGFTDTEMLRRHVPEEAMEGVRAMSAYNRLIDPDEIADTLFWAASNPVINGSVIHANLGQVES